MKYFFTLMVILSVLVGCSGSEHNMQVSGTVKGLKKGTIILQKFDDTLLISVDSIEVDGDPNFSFSSEVKSPEMYFLYLRLKNGTLLDDRIPFFAEASEITIHTTLEDFGNKVSITGSENQKKLEAYKKLMARYSDKNLDLIEAQLEAQRSGNDSLAAALELQKNKIISGKYLATVNYAVNQNDHEIAPYLMLSEIFDANIKYLDTVYNSLTPRVKESKYGKELALFISNRKSNSE